MRKDFKGFTNCEMTKLYYDEEKSNIEIRNYFMENHEIERVKIADQKDFIVLYADFDVGLENDQNSGFMTYSNHKGWILAILTNCDFRCLR